MWIWSPLKILCKFNVFSILTKHLSCTVTTTLAVWGVKAKLVQIFSPFTFSQKIHSDLQISATSAFDFFSITSSLTGSTFRLLFGIFNFACITTFTLWGHYSVKQEWVAYEHWGALTVDLITEAAAEWWMGRIIWTKRWFMSPRDRAEGKGQGVITILKVAHHLKFTSCLFLEFST